MASLAVQMYLSDKLSQQMTETCMRSQQSSMSSWSGQVSWWMIPSLSVDARYTDIATSDTSPFGPQSEYPLQDSN
jgi:hypothetical protein